MSEIQNMTLLEYMDEYGKTCKVNVQDVKIPYPVNELIKCLPDDKACGHGGKYHVHLKHIEDLQWVLNSKVLPDI